MNKLYLFISGFFIAIFTFASFSFAQTTTAGSTGATGAAANLRATCAETTWCAQNRDVCNGGGDPWHRIRITSNNLKAVGGASTYIVDCLAPGGENVCTTGNSQLDIQVFGVDNYSKLQTSVGYEFVGIFDANNNPLTNPVVADAYGNFGPIEWESATVDNITHKIMILNYFFSAAPDVSQVGGQQQATLDFSVLSEECVTYAFDPYGRVFDADSLEPLKGLSVELLSKSAEGTLTRYRSELGTVRNPQQTQSNGMFRFVVPDGTYNLKVTDPSGAYTFPVDQLASVNSGYAAIYKDIYPSQMGLDIVQAGKIQHRDIPVKLAAGRTPQNNPVEIMEVHTGLKKGSGKFIAEGVVSHPFATVNLWTQKATTPNAAAARYRMVGSVKSDREGNFRILVDENLFETGEDVLEVEAVKAATAMQNTQGTSLWQKLVSLFVKEVDAQTVTGAGNTTTVKVDPIPNFLQGYAYDSAGNVIPNATVGVYLEFSNKPSYTVKADQTGLFTISSEYLPPMAYTLRYTSPSGAVTKATTSDFIKQNAVYFKENMIDVSTFRDSKGNPAPQPTVAPSQEDKMAMDEEEVKESGNNNLIVAIVLLVLMVVVSIILGMYLLKKSKAPDMKI